MVICGLAKLPDEWLDDIIGFLWPRFGEIACTCCQIAIVARVAVRRSISKTLGLNAAERFCVPFEALLRFYSWRPRLIVVGGACQPCRVASIRQPLYGDGPAEIKLMAKLTEAQSRYQEHSVAIVGGYAWVTNDCDHMPSLLRLNLAANRWEAPVTLPSSPNERGAGPALATQGEHLVISGGYLSGDMRAVWKLDLITHTWKELPSMITGRRDHGFVGFKGTLLAAGGSSLEFVSLRSVESLASGSECWVRMADMRRPRDMPSLVFISATMYVFGGYDTRGDYDDEPLPFERYDADLDEWVDVDGEKYQEQCRAFAVTCNNQEVVVFDEGGSTVFGFSRDGLAINSRKHSPCPSGCGWSWSRGASVPQLCWVGQPSP